MYVFFPVAFMVWIGHPSWYESYVKERRQTFYPKHLNEPAQTQQGIQEQLSELMAKKKERKNDDDEMTKMVQFEVVNVFYYLLILKNFLIFFSIKG